MKSNSNDHPHLSSSFLLLRDANRFWRISSIAIARLDSTQVHLEDNQLKFAFFTTTTIEKVQSK
ncbi:hypothetical protein T05_10031 [Trichinella murrelli]|uniref:Uncharacterized protein n=1 Tax=Trichinella murrelli TaxID=144512 RepID=A0A0V0UJ20_9BILA|nr:hypothetical protein T05_10031 [Trichinella murrelli]